ncbi:hypothetical protein CDL15_Pgr008617 [Punica granatum]|uniref:FLZ-type domain-containing protein n=1 Tax=Punica granatum TaxID=22663 RepID=A0A218WNV3_PUNGR|nr:hypothetical protein CDL15_Pgr008617 [Punica granatum]
MYRTTSCGEIGTVTMSPEDALAAWFRKKFPNQNKPATSTSRPNYNNQQPEVEESKRKTTVNPGAGAVKPSQDTISSTAHSRSENHVQQLLRAASTLPKKSIFFIGFPEKETGDDIRAIGYRDLVKSCASCKKELEPEKDVYIYRAQTFCSLNCRDKPIALDGYTGKQVGLEINDVGATPKPLRRNGRLTYTCID